MSFLDNDSRQRLAGYQAPDVQCNGITDDQMRRLLANDPVVGGLCVERLWWNEPYDYENGGKIRRALSGSTHLRMLKYNWHADESYPDVLTFFTWVAANRSIEHLHLMNDAGFGYLVAADGDDYDGLHIFEVLAPFFEKNMNLRCIEIDGFFRSWSVPYLISALSKTNRLERLDLLCNIGDEAAACLIFAMNSMPGLINLVELCLTCAGIGRRSCQALRRLLTNPMFKIHLLDLGYNGIDDECIKILTKALVQNNTIKVLHLDFSSLVTSLGWSELSAYLSNSECSLQKLVLTAIIAYTGASSLVNSLALNNTLKCLDLGIRLAHHEKRIAWRIISPFFRSPNSALERLDLNLGPIDDEGALLAIAILLAENKALKALSLSYSISITPAGWTRCFQWLLDSGSKSNVEKLVFNTTNIDDVGAALFANWLVAQTSLKELIFSSNSSITASGWIQCFSVLAESENALEKLVIWSTNIDDSGAALLIDSLGTTTASNLISLHLCDNNGITTNLMPSIVDVLLQSTSFPKLKELGIDIVDDDFLSGIAAAMAYNTNLEVLSCYTDAARRRQWRAMETALCNNSSIDTIIYHSNHTLHTYSEKEEWDCLRSADVADSVGNALCYLLEINNGKNKAEVVRTKILQFYFSDVANIRPAFDGVAMSVLPTAIAWIDRDQLGFSTLYFLLRDMPSRFVCNLMP